MSTANTNLLHQWHHDDYEEAKRQIYQHLGDTSDLEIFGRQVVVAVYVRPNKTAGGFFLTVDAQKEDVWQGKAVLIVKMGPDAFRGDDSYVEATYGFKGAPRPGDWVFLRAQDGLAVSLCGDGASRAQGKDMRGSAVDIYGWDGWPCRIVADETVIGRINKPHEIV
jgi:hypothetical protein